MPERSFDDILQHFKNSEKDRPEMLAPLMQNKDLQNALVAWQGIEVQYEHGLSYIGEAQDDVTLWNFLWQSVKYNPKQFAEVGGMEEHKQKPVFSRLRGLRLIYPDGTINGLARQYIQSQIMADLEKRTRRPGRPKNS